MKLLTTLTAVALVGFTLTLAYAEEGKAPGKGKGEGRRGPGPGMEHLLPPRLIGDLSLTADQKAQYDELTAAFKKEADAWEKAHPGFHDEARKAREAGDKNVGGKLKEQRKSLMEARKGYVDKFRTSLTDEQKAKLDKSIEDAKDRMGKGPRGEKGERKGDKKGPKPPPAE